MRLSRGRKGDGSVDREFRPYGNIMEGLNALRSRIPSTVVASTASTAATLKPVMAAKATTSPMPYRGPMSSASGSGGGKGSEDRSEYMNCNRRRVLVDVSEETIADDIRKINGAVKAVWHGLEKVSKPKMQLNLEKRDGKVCYLSERYHGQTVRDLKCILLEAPQPIPPPEDHGQKQVELYEMG